MGQQSGYRGAPPPGQLQESVYDVIAPAMGERLDVVILGDYVYGVQCHWVIDPETKKGTSVACDAWRDDCKRCRDKVRSMWLGFIPVYKFAGRTRCILRVGPETARRMLAKTNAILGLRGHAWQLGRGEEQRTGALMIEPSPFDAPHPLPAPCKLRHTLMIVLKTDNLPDDEYVDADEIPLPEGGAS